MKSKDYYGLLIEGKYMCPTGFRKWSNHFGKDVTKELENSLKRTQAIVRAQGPANYIQIITPLFLQKESLYAVTFLRTSNVFTADG